MSYSFSVKASTKVEVKAAVAAKLAEVVLSQPVHAGDQMQAQAAADAFIDLVPEDATKDYSVSMNGSAMLVDGAFTSAGVGVSVFLVAKT